MKKLLIFIHLSAASILPAWNDIDLTKISSFVYQLQDLNLDAVGATSFDLVIMDYSAEGDDETAYSSDQIEALKVSRGGRKIVLCYLSIGEAEDYRFYWHSGWLKNAPDWLDGENPDWKGNYRVRYWYEDWQVIIEAYLDRVLAAHFNGVYLDLIDAYETYLPLNSVQATLEMVRFVKRIQEYGLARDPDFLIFVQNGADLATVHPEYLNAVDGIGQEDIYYGYNADGQKTPATITEQLETYLNLFSAAGKIVMTVDYPFSDNEDRPYYDTVTVEKIRNAYLKSRQQGFIPYCTVRNLNYLTINPGFEPSGCDKTEDEHYLLDQNYPNPFNHQTSIPFEISGKARVRAAVFDIQGREVCELADNVFDAGRHYLRWQPGNQESGVYFCRIETDRFIALKKMVFLK
jgi:cysteinyl-tRNA synthetase